ncbi:hypothetical protein FJT64_026094 [Amphibalanus amphitrite]|uniref:Uncharacterized protein n=1 Tax=Amphibalanus amphitrite TaxID=1232801 RepID=A0A6A4W933_AMPAM|nr:hypothetical protein FJT64_026094 [Amphibalanus amphitrite]
MGYCKDLSCFLVACAGLLALQCHELAVLFVSEPTALIRSTEPADSMTVPGMTVCPSTRLRGDVLADWGILADNGRWPDWYRFPENRTLDELWMEAAVDLNELVRGCLGGECDSQHPRGGPGVVRGHWTPVLNEMGVCYTLRLNRLMDIEGSYFKLHFYHSHLHTLVGESGAVHVFLHGEEPPVVEAGDWLRPGLVLPHPHVTIHPGERLDVEARGELEQCIRHLQAGRLGCRAPWMPGPAEQGCRSRNEVLAFIVPPEVTPGQVRRHCHCDPGCTRERWTLTELERKVVEGGRLYNVSFLTVRWAEWVRVTREQLTYGTSSLLSDIGGIVGILFGASLLGVVQAAEQWLPTALPARWRRRNGQQPQARGKRMAAQQLGDGTGADGVKGEDAAGNGAKGRANVWVLPE